MQTINDFVIIEPPTGCDFISYTAVRCVREPMRPSGRLLLELWPPNFGEGTKRAIRITMQGLGGQKDTNPTDNVGYVNMTYKPAS